MPLLVASCKRVSRLMGNLVLNKLKRSYLGPGSEIGAYCPDTGLIL